MPLGISALKVESQNDERHGIRRKVKGQQIYDRPQLVLVKPTRDNFCNATIDQFENAVAIAVAAPYRSLTNGAYCTGN